jgi:hypothetical protein
MLSRVPLSMDLTILSVPSRPLYHYNHPRDGTHSSRYSFPEHRMARRPTCSSAHPFHCHGSLGNDRGTPVYYFQHNQHGGRLGFDVQKDWKLDEETVRDGADECIWGARSGAREKGQSDGRWAIWYVVESLGPVVETKLDCIGGVASQSL